MTNYWGNAMFPTYGFWGNPGWFNSGSSNSNDNKDSKTTASSRFAGMGVPIENNEENRQKLLAMFAPNDPSGGAITGALYQAAAMDQASKAANLSNALGVAGLSGGTGTALSGGSANSLTNLFASFLNPTSGANDPMSAMLKIIILKALFDAASESGDSEISDEEVEALAEKIGIDENNWGTVKKGIKDFNNIDTNKDKYLSFSEYQRSFLETRKKDLGRELTDKEYKKYKREARNLFNAMAVNGRISKTDYKKMLNFFDASDGEKDGRIKGNLMSKAIKQIRQNGADTQIYRGKTLREVLDTYS